MSYYSATYSTINNEYWYIPVNASVGSCSSFSCINSLDNLAQILPELYSGIMIFVDKHVKNQFMDDSDVEENLKEVRNKIEVGFQIAMISIGIISSIITILVILYPFLEKKKKMIEVSYECLDALESAQLLKQKQNQPESNITKCGFLTVIFFSLCHYLIVLIFMMMVSSSLKRFENYFLVKDTWDSLVYIFIEICHLSQIIGIAISFV
jgi:hypothetical protein